MELKTTEEFVREAHSAACSTWKTKIEKEFPELFKTEFEVNKWYKGSVDFESLIFITEIENAGDYNRVYYYGFINDTYKNGYIAHSLHEASLIPARPEEIEALLISEAKKRGFLEGAKFKSSLSENGKIRTVREDGSWNFYTETNRLNISTPEHEWGYSQSNPTVFRDGEWTEILTEEKTTISKEKALKILAKKLKVSPESIEIK